MKNSYVALDSSWLAHLASEFKKPYMLALKQFLTEQKQKGKVIYPKGSDMFNAFNSTPFDQTKVVILGQDPYHGPNQAHGLSFSVPEGIALPPSLKNIYKAVAAQLNVTMPNHGCLQQWADEGVLLLNATLSVEQANAGAHQKKGWETFTDQAITRLNEHRECIVFMLWGNFARKKAQLIDSDRHLVLESAHPSPLSAHRGFLTNNHFSTANEYLLKHNKAPINWAMS